MRCRTKPGFHAAPGGGGQVSGFHRDKSSMNGRNIDGFRSLPPKNSFRFTHAAPVPWPSLTLPFSLAGGPAALVQAMMDLSIATDPGPSLQTIRGGGTPYGLIYPVSPPLSKQPA